MCQYASQLGLQLQLQTFITIFKSLKLILSNQVQNTKTLNLVS